MKRPSKTTSKSNNKMEDFLKDFMVNVNDGIHADLERSQDYLNKYELDDYIDKEKGLNITAIEDDEDLTVEQVVEIAIHWARHTTHKNWHEAMDEIAEKHGVPKQSGHGASIEAKVQVITDPSQLPPEVREAIGEALESIIKSTKKKRGGKK